MVWSDAVTAFFFPARCPFCNELIPYTETLCNGCARHMPRHREGCIFVHNEKDARCFAPFWYQDMARDAVLRMKYRRNFSFLPLFVSALTPLLQKEAFDLILCVGSERNVSLHLKKMAKKLGKNLNTPFDFSVIRRKEGIPKQHTLSKTERYRNVVDAFYCANSDIIQGKRILLLDDVITTGATLKACRKLLLENGALSVTAAVLAATSEKNEEN